MVNLKFGRRTPKRAPRLLFSEFWKGVIPDHPQSVDYLKALNNWQMLGNDQYGDCVAVYAANLTRLVSATLATEYYPSQEEVIALYKTQNPNFPYDDNGMDMQTMLEYWNKNAWAGRKIVAFAQVDFHDLNQLKAAIAIFGAVGPGIVVTQANMDEFDAGKPWNYVARSAQLGGHAILAGGYSGVSTRDIDFITWAQETSFTDSDVAHAWEECWLVIFEEHFGTKQFQQGVDVSALASAYQALTGRPLPIPTPPTPPTPTPSDWKTVFQNEHVWLQMK